MAVDKYTVEIVDSEGNSSKLVLPGFALDSTQEKLIKSVQALGKLNPKQAEAYEKLLEATNDASKKGKDATDKQTEELEKVLTVTSEKQVKALRTFREAFADRVGKDMRDTFVAGGNILTAAIKTATVGLAAGAGLLYKTFMDTSDAFRSLALSGLGSGGATGTEAQDAVANLTRLGMSASEAASMLTSFGRASAVLGKANFSKFVAGIAGSTSFAAELGLTLEEAAEFTASEVEMRQKALAGRMQLDAFTEVSIKENIRLTQAMSSLFGRSMKDIQQAKEDFLTKNAQLATLMLRLPANISEKAVKEISDMLTVAGGFGGDIEQLMNQFLNAGASAIPMADSFAQSMMSLGPAGTWISGELRKFNNEIETGSVNARSTMLNLIDRLASINKGKLLSILEQSSDPVAGMLARAARDAKQGGEQLRNAMLGIGPAMDPMIESGVRLRNTLSQVQGAFTTFILQGLGGLATPLNNFMQALTDTGITKEQEKIAKQRIKEFEQERRLRADASDAEIESYKKDREALLEEVYERKKGTSVIKALNDALNDVGKTVLKVFFGDINPAAEDFGKKLREDLIPWIERTAKDLKQWLEDLEGDTFGEKLKALLSGLVTSVIVPALSKVIVETFKALLTNPYVLLGIAGAFAIGIGKAFLMSAITSKMSMSSSAAAGAVKSAGNTLALAIRQVAMAVRRAGAGLGVAGPMGGPAGGGRRGRGGRGMRLNSFLGKASIAGIGANIVGGIASDALYEAGHEKTAAGVDTVANVAGMAGTGALIGSVIPGVGTAVGALVGGVAGLGMSVYQNWDTWFGSDEGQEAISEAGQEAIEGIDATGMAAMAMDPQHIRNVSLALEDFNKISVDNIASGLSKLSPALTSLFTNLEKIKTAFVDRISVRLERLVAVLTNFNIEGVKLPVTTENLVNLANQIISIPTDPLTKLATSFSALTLALKDFSELTTSTFFSRMMNGFTSKQDETANIIKTLNDFAKQVETTKLSDAAAAIQSFSAAIANVARPTDVARSSPVNQAQAATDTATTTSPMTSAQQSLADDRMETTMRRIEYILDRQTGILNTIKENTDPAKQR